MKITIGIATILSATLLATPALAGDPKDDRIVIKVGTVAPKDTPWSDLLLRVKKRYKTQSNKKIKLKVYWGGSLGGEKEMVRETREGRVHLFGGSTAALATMVPELYVLESPYLFESDQEADFVLDNYARPHVKKLLAAKGFVFFQFAENGWHGLALKQSCITSINDLKGKKIRSQEAKIHLDMFKALGANPVPISVPEVLPALEQGVVDGFSNTPLFSFATSWYQGVKYYTVTNHIYQPAILAYSAKWFKKQPKDIQKILLDGAEEDEKYGRRGVREIRDGLLNNFTRSKIKVCQVDDKLRADLVKATSKIFGKYRKRATKKGRPLFDAILKGKADWAKKNGK